jgi:hypothetical protein
MIFALDIHTAWKVPFEDFKHELQILINDSTVIGEMLKPSKMGHSL